MTAAEIKYAWEHFKLVTYNPPNESPIKNCVINAVIYRRHPKSKHKMVSCELQDPKAKNSIIIARSNKLTLQDNVIKD